MDDVDNNEDYNDDNDDNYEGVWKLCPEMQGRWRIIQVLHLCVSVPVWFEYNGPLSGCAWTSSI